MICHIYPSYIYKKKPVEMTIRAFRQAVNINRNNQMQMSISISDQQETINTM